MGLSAISVSNVERADHGLGVLVTLAGLFRFRYLWRAATTLRAYLPAVGYRTIIRAGKIDLQIVACIDPEMGVKHRTALDVAGSSTDCYGFVRAFMTIGRSPMYP